MDSAALLDGGCWFGGSSGGEGESSDASDPSDTGYWSSSSSTVAPEDSSSSSGAFADSSSDCPSPCVKWGAGGGGGVSERSSSDQSGWLPDHPLMWEQVIDILTGKGLGIKSNFPTRPLILGPELEHMIYLEAPKIRRRESGGDIWVCSGVSADHPLACRLLPRHSGIPAQLVYFSRTV
eukprot:COSAG01_NODE_984_length_12344_cov_215.085362_13_plen_179_part_00